MARKGRGSNDQGKGRHSPAGPGTCLKSKEDGGSNEVWAVKVGGGSSGTLFCEHQEPRVCCEPGNNMALAFQSWVDL